MSNKWVFSPSSAPYLQRCIAAAPPPDLDNKWFRAFGKKASLIEPDSSEKDKSAIIENNLLDVDKDKTVSYENFFNLVESESTIPIEYVMHECEKNPALITKMAERLSTNHVEQLFNQIFSKTNKETYFTFIKTFLPTYTKLHTSRISIDLLLELNKVCPQLFVKLLEILINDSEIPNQVLNNYIAAINEESVTNFMKTLSTIEISSEGFVQNVIVIYTAYKDCIKDDQIQNYILKMIIQHSKPCSTDRNFGRLLLTYLQSEKAMARKLNVQILEECLEVHKSPFKRPCIMLIKEL